MFILGVYCEYIACLYWECIGSILLVYNWEYIGSILLVYIGSVLLVYIGSILGVYCLFIAKSPISVKESRSIVVVPVS